LGEWLGVGICAHHDVTIRDDASYRAVSVGDEHVANPLVAHHARVDAPSGAELGNNDPEGNQSKGPQALNREQKTEELSSDEICERSWQRHAQQEAHMGRIKSAGISLLHQTKLSSACQPVKEDFSASNTSRRRWVLNPIVKQSAIS